MDGGGGAGAGAAAGGAAEHITGEAGHLIGEEAERVAALCRALQRRARPSAWRLLLLSARRLLKVPPRSFYY